MSIYAVTNAVTNPAATRSETMLNCGGLDSESCLKSRQFVVDLDPYNLNASAFVSPLVTYQIRPFGWVGTTAAAKQAAATTRLAAQAQATALAQTSDPAIQALTQQAHNACYVEQDGASCMSLNYQLAAKQAELTGPYGAVTMSLIDRKRRGSIDNWFVAPVPYTTVKPVPSDTAAVATTMGRLAQATAVSTAPYN
jgi:hypothetical protein